MSEYLGDFAAGAVVRKKFNTCQADGTPITLAGTPVAKAYKDGSTSTEVTTGVTLVVDFDSATGLHQVAVDTTSDGTFYAGGSDFSVILTAGTVNSISVAGQELFCFSLANRSTAAIKAKTDNLPSDPADASDVAGAFSTVNATLATIAGYVDTEVAAIKAKTDQLTFTVSNKLDATVSGYASGQDPATLVLDATASGHNTSLTVGSKINAAASAGDPWSTALPGSYSSGQAGYIVGTNLNATVSGVSGLNAAGVRNAVGLNAANLDTQLAARSGFKLASDGLDSIVVEASAGGAPVINARQALALVMDAAGSGVLSGAATSTVTVKNPGGTSNRIVAECDSNGNRSSVTLTPPA